jgi:hypothetical protein
MIVRYAPNESAEDLLRRRYVCEQKLLQTRLEWLLQLGLTFRSPLVRLEPAASSFVGRVYLIQVVVDTSHKVHGCIIQSPCRAV